MFFFISLKKNQKELKKMIIVDNKSDIDKVTKIYNQLQSQVMNDLSESIDCHNSLQIMKTRGHANVGTTAKKDNFNVDIQFIQLDNTFAHDPITGTDLISQVNNEIKNSNNSITLKSVIYKTILMVTPYQHRKKLVVMDEHERKVLDIIAPMLFKILFIENGPLNRFISLSKSKSSKSSGIIERLTKFRHDIDLVTLWTNLLNMDMSTTGTLSAELSLQKIVSTECNNIMADFYQTIKHRSLNTAANKSMLMKSNAKPNIEEIKKKVWSQNIIKLMKGRFKVKQHIIDLFESMLWTVSHTHIWNVRKEWKQELIISELENGFEDNMTSIVIGMGLFNTNVDVEEGIKHLIDIHDTFVRLLHNSVNHNPPDLINYETNGAEFLEHINAFLNAVLGTFQPDIYKTMQLLLSCVLSYQSLHHTDKNVTYSSVQKLIRTYSNAIESQLESFYQRYQTNIEKNLVLGYEITEDVMTNSADPSKSIDTLIYDSVLKHTDYNTHTDIVKMSKQSKRIYPTNMIHPLMSFIMFTMYMHQLHKQINIKNTQKIKHIMLKDIVSIVPIPNDLQEGIIHSITDIIVHMCIGNRNGYREIPESLNQFDSKSLFTMCIILNNMIAYSNGIESPFSPSNIYKNLYFNTVGIHADMTTSI